MTELDRFDIFASNFVYDHLMKCSAIDDPKLATATELANIFDAFDNYIRCKYGAVSASLNRFDIVNEFVQYAKEEG